MGSKTQLCQVFFVHNILWNFYIFFVSALSTCFYYPFSYYPSYNPFSVVRLWGMFEELVNTEHLYWSFIQLQLHWIMRHHLLTIIICLGICHTKSFNSSHWRPGCHFTDSVGKNFWMEWNDLLLITSSIWKLHARLWSINFWIIKLI